MLTVINGDCRAELKQLADESVHCCVTSPPYWGLRDYGVEGQLGLEPTPEAYVAEMVAIFREVRRVLRSDGTAWINLGDSYTGSWGNYSGQNRGNGNQRDIMVGSLPAPAWNDRELERPAASRPQNGLKPKDLCGIPWMVAFALRADGWYLRSEIIWHKPNPMPESVTDRPTKSHEQVFLLAKSSRYFYDAEAIKESQSPSSLPRLLRGVSESHKNVNGAPGQTPHSLGNPRRNGEGYGDLTSISRNRRTVWTIATQPYTDAHFATFPPKLVEPCILAGTSARGCCAACGAPWERVVERTGWPDPDENGDDQGRMKASGDIATDTGRRKELSGAKHAAFKAANPDEPIGWRPTCHHYNRADEWVEYIPYEDNKNPTYIELTENQRRRELRKELCQVFANYESDRCVVLDPFAGSGTVGQVALEAGRRAILIELNAKYCEMIERRNQVTLGLPGLA